ncbi:MAG: 3-phosphoserine/phosphohydroxythreonine transaminase, partial [Myxococcota bacterium]
EMSHRSATYEAVHDRAIANLRELMKIPDGYQVIFMGGGARTQFALVPYNLGMEGVAAEYVLTGTWSEGAVREANKLGEARAVWSGADGGYRHIPRDDEYTASDDAAFFHYTSNNTIYGTQFHEPPAASSAPLVCDMSSDILAGPVDVSRFGLIYAGAQKNIGPAGVTVVIVRDDLLERSGDALPELWSYKKIAAKNSLLNTPPTFAIYVVKLVTDWVKECGGLEKIAEKNREKADLIYAQLDGEFYRGHADEASRSVMNATFNLPTPELEAEFVAFCASRDLHGVKGHRSVGGIRASLYNAVPVAAAEALAQAMTEFRAERG